MFRVPPFVSDAKRSRRFVSSLGLAIALAAGGSLGLTALASPAQAQSEKPNYSKKFQKPGQQAAANLNARRTAPEVDAEVNNLVAAFNALQTAKRGTDKAAIASAQAQVDAVSAKLQQMTAAERQEVQGLLAIASNPDEKFYVGDQLDYLGRFTNNPELRMLGLRTKLESGVLKPESVGSSWSDLAKIYYDMGRFDDCAEAYKAAYNAGMESEAVFAADAMFRANRLDDGLAYLYGVIADRRAAGKNVPQEWVGTGVNQVIPTNDIAKIGQWTALYGAVGNSVESWNAAINLLAGSMTFSIDSQDDLERSLDLYRLMDRTQSLKRKQDYIAYLQSAMGRAGIAYPGEVVKAAEAGVAAGAIDSDDERLTNARTLIDSDRKALPELEKDARKAANGDDALAAGDAYLSYGMDAKAEEMFTLALSKGVSDMDRLYTRLAIAQADQDKYAEARENFAKVGGKRKAIADMWTAYVNTKSPPMASAETALPQG